MVSYKAVLSKIFTRSPSLNLTDDSTSPYRATRPLRALSFPILPSPKLSHEEPTSIPPRTRRVLVRRPNSANLGSHGGARSFFARSRRNSISTSTAPRPRTYPLTVSPITSLSEEGFVDLGPSIPFWNVDPSSTHSESSSPTVPESCDIDLLLSNEPGDAKKAIIKRLEGLALALEDVTGTTVKTFQKKPSISFKDLPPHMAVTSEFLSPIENWEDEDPMDRNMFAYHRHVDDDAHSSSHSQTQWSSSDSCSSSWISDADDAKPPLTPNLTVAQYPLSFHLEPIPQVTLDICKSTPSPVFPHEISDRTSLMPVENVVVSWDNEQHPP